MGSAALYDVWIARYCFIEMLYIADLVTNIDVKLAVGTRMHVCKLFVFIDGVFGGFHLASETL